MCLIGLLVHVLSTIENLTEQEENYTYTWYIKSNNRNAMKSLYKFITVILLNNRTRFQNWFRCYMLQKFVPYIISSKENLSPDNSELNAGGGGGGGVTLKYRARKCEKLVAFGKS